MKNKKWWIKFKNGNVRLVMLALISYGAGLSMLIMPEKTSDLVIRGVGFVWTMEAISYTLDIVLKYLKKRKEALSIHSVSTRSQNEKICPHCNEELKGFGGCANGRCYEC